MREAGEVPLAVSGPVEGDADGSPARGRPSAYTEELEAEILRLICSGQSVRAISRREDMPAESTIYRWLSEPGHPFSEKFARARAAREWGILEQIEDLARLVVAGRVDPRAAWAAGALLDRTLARMACKFKRAGVSGGAATGDGLGDASPTGVLVIEAPARSYEEACARVGQRPEYLDRVADGLRE